MRWHQRAIRLRERPRGCHLVTDEIVGQMPELDGIEVGIAQVFIQHTSASLTINENADPTVRRDFESNLNRLFPEDPALYEHLDEGLDDSASHLKASVLGPSVSIPISRGRLALGTWQGIYLCEHRNHSRPRTVVVTLMGE